MLYYELYIYISLLFSNGNKFLSFVLFSYNRLYYDTLQHFKYKFHIKIVLDEACDDF